MPSLIMQPASDDTTRDRILKAAMLRFSTHSYEETGLRDIAADVGVDMAYVHRCFGSKEKLFRAAVAAIFQPELTFGGDADELHCTLAREALAVTGANEIRPLDIVVRSFSSPEASRVLREEIEANFTNPLSSKRNISPKRAALIGAFLAGFGISRNVIQLAELQEPEGGELEALLAQVIAGLIEVEPDDDGIPARTQRAQEKKQ